MRIVFFIISLAAAIATVRADENTDEKLPVLKVGKNVYSNVTVMVVSATDIYFSSDKGLANAKLKELDAELQKHFHYDPVKAGEAEQKQTKANSLYQMAVSHPSASQTSTNDARTVEQAAMTEPGSNKIIWARPVLDQKAPDFYVAKWLTDKPDCRGKFVLIDFWVTWSPACRALIPQLNYYQKKFNDRLVVIGVSDEPEDTVKKFVDPKIEYYSGIDPQARTKNALQVTAMPHLLLVDPQGIVRWEGYPFLQGHELDDKVIGNIIDKYSN